jgi:hypothetical protein
VRFLLDLRSCISFEEIDSLQRIEKKTIVSFKPIGANFVHAMKKTPKRGNHQK